MTERVYPGLAYLFGDSTTSLPIVQEWRIVWRVCPYTCTKLVKYIAWHRTL